MSELKAGDRIVFCKGKKNKCLVDITFGKIYTVVYDPNEVVFIDDRGDKNYSANLEGIGKATKIID